MTVRLRTLGLLLGIGSLGACAAPRLPTPAPLTAPETISIRSGGRVQIVPLEDYVLGTALSEVSPVGAPPAAVNRIFEVQAILARTYALAHLGRHRSEGFDLCDQTHCQLYEPARIRTSRFTPAAADATARTRGIVLLFGRRPAEALYHSDCGGHTASAGDVWGGADVPYLTGHPDNLPALTHRTWRFDAPADRLRRALNLDARSAIGRRLDRIVVRSRDASGRAAAVEVKGEQTRVLRGEDARAVINRTFGDRAIMSTRLSVERRGSTYVFSGTGFGHGVGLCQTGAAARAAGGQATADILEAYFPGAVLSRPSAQRPVASGNLMGGTGPTLLKFP